MSCPTLYLVIPCFNEQETLPKTAPLFVSELARLIRNGRIGEDSRILFVDDGSTDDTWPIIKGLCRTDPTILGLSLSRNRGHQNALLAGILEAKDKCDILITADCDGQDDPAAIDAMIARWEEGCDIVYGVRRSRDADSPAKRGSARLFYRFLSHLGAETVEDHADFRLLSARAADALSQYREVHLYLRGIVPLIGYKSATVEYDRLPRIGGKSHYSFGRMLSLGMDALTSFSVRPLRILSAMGFFVSLLSFIGIIWIFIQHFTGNTVSGWSSILCVICFVSGIQLIALGVVGEYIGRIYMEVKGRPRYFIAERSWENEEDRRA